jgi:hypothetical protein
MEDKDVEMNKISLKMVMGALAGAAMALSLAACGGGDPAADAQAEAEALAQSLTTEAAQGRRRPGSPAINCTNATAQMAALVAAARVLEVERAQIRAEQAANDTGNGNFSVKDQALADRLLARETTNQNAMNANGQARSDLSRACGIPFGLTELEASRPRP